MPRKSVKIQAKADTTNEKRILIDSLELLRGNTPHKSENKGQNTASGTPIPQYTTEISVLRQEVKKLQSANILLENDLKNMEQKALEAIAESGHLRHQLDMARDNSSANQNRYYEEERQALLSELRHSRYTHQMLSEAVTESQNEITRLTRTLEKLTFKLLVA